MIVLVIILICGAGVGGWVLGTKYANKEDAKTEEKAKKEETDNKTSGEEKLPELDVPNSICGGSNFTFKQKTVEAKDISDEDKLNMLSEALASFIPDDYYKSEAFENSEKITLDIDIMEYAKKYFDVTPSLEKAMKEGFGDPAHFKYEDNKSYFIFLHFGCTGPSTDGDYTEPKDSKKDGNTLIKSYYYYYVVNDEDPIGLLIKKIIDEKNSEKKVIYTPIQP